MNSPLLGLPPELIVRIASNLTTPELCPFRQSCKQVEKFLFNSFAKEFFTKRQFMVEHESLDALVGIASHPGLAIYLQEVIISTQKYQLGMSHTENLPQFLEDRYLNGYAMREDLLARGDAHAMLVKAFSKLPNLCVVGVRDFDGAERHRAAGGERWRSWGWSKLNCLEYGRPNPVFTLVMSAMCAANVRPAKLEVILRRRQSLSAMAFNSTERDNAAKVLPGLRTLMLNLQEEYHRDPMMSSNRERVLQDAAIKRFLARLTNLEHLRLNFHRDQLLAVPLLRWMHGSSLAEKGYERFHTQVPSFSNLHTMEIGTAALEDHSLINVLSHLNLRAFSLWKIHLEFSGIIPEHPSNDQWELFLSRLSRKLPPSCKIQSIMIGMVTQDLKHNPSSWERYRPVTWVPKGSNPSKKAVTPSHLTIKYDYTACNETAIEWLAMMSKLVYVPSGLPSAEDSDTSFGGSDAGFEEQNEAEEDEEADENDDDDDESDDDMLLDNGNDQNGTGE